MEIEQTRTGKIKGSFSTGIISHGGGSYGEIRPGDTVCILHSDDSWARVSPINSHLSIYIPIRHIEFDEIAISPSAIAQIQPKEQVDATNMNKERPRRTLQTWLDRACNGISKKSAKIKTTLLHKDKAILTDEKESHLKDEAKRLKLKLLLKQTSSEISHAPAKLWVSAKTRSKKIRKYLVQCYEDEMSHQQRPPAINVYSGNFSVQLERVKIPIVTGMETLKDIQESACEQFGLSKDFDHLLSIVDISTNAVIHVPSNMSFAQILLYMRSIYGQQFDGANQMDHLAEFYEKSSVPKGLELQQLLDEMLRGYKRVINSNRSKSGPQYALVLNRLVVMQEISDVIPLILSVEIRSHLNPDVPKDHLVMKVRHNEQITDIMRRCCKYLQREYNSSYLTRIRASVYNGLDEAASMKTITTVKRTRIPVKIETLLPVTIADAHRLYDASKWDLQSLTLVLHLP